MNQQVESTSLTVNGSEAGHDVCRACFQLSQLPGGLICGWPVHPSQDEAILWGLGSYRAASMPPTQMHPV